MGYSKAGFVSFVASFALIACSSAPGGPIDNPPSGTKVGGSGSSTSANSAPAGGSNGNGGGTTTNSDPTKPNPGPTDPGPNQPDDAEDACVDKCETANPAGLAVMDPLDDEWTKCVCAKCAAQCGQSVCAANQTEAADGDACDQCLDTATSCDDQWQTACDANADCKNLDACETACDPDEAADGANDADDADRAQAQAYASRTRTRVVSTAKRIASMRVVGGTQ
jgi:hypothetical protein